MRLCRGRLHTNIVANGAARITQTGDDSIIDYHGLETCFDRCSFAFEVT